MTGEAISITVELVDAIRRARIAALEAYAQRARDQVVAPPHEHSAAISDAVVDELLGVSCPHLSWTGVEADSDLDDPAKVWRCDMCGRLRTGAEQTAADWLEARP